MNEEMETGYVQLPPLISAAMAKSIVSHITKEDKLREELLRLNQYVQEAARAANSSCYYSVEHEDIEMEFLKAVEGLGYKINVKSMCSDILIISW